MEINPGPIIHEDWVEN